MSSSCEFRCDVCRSAGKGYYDMERWHAPSGWVTVELKVGAVHQVADVCGKCLPRVLDLIPALEWVRPGQPR